MRQGGVRDRRRGGPGTDPIRSDPIRSSGDFPYQTAVQIRDNHVNQEPSDPPAPQRSSALDLPRVDQPNPHSVAELPSVVYDQPLPVQSPTMPTVSYAAATIVPRSVPINNHQSLLSLLPLSKAAVKVGPWGGNGGDPWDDGVGFDGIRQITVYFAGCIDAIQVEYTKNGTPVRRSKHGGNGGAPTEFNLRTHEYITKVTGHYGEFEGHTVLRSLKFTTNQRILGPLGSEEGTAFVLPVVGGRFIGFFGCSGKYLDAIGVRIASNSYLPRRMYDS